MEDSRDDGSLVESWLTQPVSINRARPRSCVDSFVQSARAVLLGSRMNILILCLPAAVLFDSLEISSLTFIASLTALIPLAERLGFVTEELAAHTNDTLGGLLNATFGNATELIICTVSLYNAGQEHDHSYLRIVQLSLLGSVLGNLLLVMGTAFLVGGLMRPEQSFNQGGMEVNSGMLLVAVSGILFPSILSQTGTEETAGSSELHLSRFESIILLILYSLYLIFQLITHKHLYESASAEHNGAASPERQYHPSTVERLVSRSPGASVEDGDAYLGVSRHTLRQMRSIIVHEDVDTDVPPTPRFPSPNVAQDLDRVEEKEEELMGMGAALCWLAAITVLIAYLSEMVVDTIQDAHESLGIPLPFLSTIMLPLVGNAAEHASAILFAYRNKMEITLGIAVGSATQIAVLVIPFTVVLAWMMGQPLDLNFEWFEAFTLFICTIIAIIAVRDGTSNWIKGLLLIATYASVSGAFWVHTDSDLSDNTY